MRVVNLASGSDGNVTYIESGDTKILIDAGLSCKAIEARLNLLNVSGSEIDAILVTHEHGDHIRGINVFAAKHNVDVYAHLDAWDLLNNQLIKLKDNQKKAFSASPFYIKDLTIKAFEIPHDSVVCVGFTVETVDKKASFLTDFGKSSPEILNYIMGSQLVYLEANHDEEMLHENVCYPASLKRRILSNKGHLSNVDCARITYFLAQNGTRQVVLSHLSRENNCPILAYNTVKNYLAEKGIIEGENIKVDVATNKPGKIYKIS